MKLPDNPDVMLQTCIGTIYAAKSFILGNTRFAEFHGELLWLDADNIAKGKSYPIRWSWL